MGRNRTYRHAFAYVSGGVGYTARGDPARSSAGPRTGELTCVDRPGSGC